MTELASSPAEGSGNAQGDISGGGSGAGLASPSASAGLLLRQAREAAGLHIAALAVSLKVPVKKLEALEADRLDLLPDAVFVRALAASVCRTLKVDASQILALLPQNSTPRLGQPQTAINAPFRAPGDGPPPSLWAQVSRPAVLAGLLLVMGTLVLIFMPAAQQQSALSPVAGDSNPAMAIGSTSAPAAAPQPQPMANVVTSAPAAVPEAPPVPPVLAAPAAPVLAPTLSAALAPVVPVPVAPPAAAAAPAASGIIVFRAKGESWVEVTDAKKVVVLRRTLTAGEEAGATGALPLLAVVGRADATQVQVRGQAFDLTNVSKDNVARFEVK